MNDNVISLSQKIRFKTLCEIGIQSTDSVLDVGCGNGDLLPFLESSIGKDVRYTGIDNDDQWIR